MKTLSKMGEVDSVPEQMLVGCVLRSWTLLREDE